MHVGALNTEAGPETKAEAGIRTLSRCLHAEPVTQEYQTVYRP